jgi:hypothetical protein
MQSAENKAEWQRFFAFVFPAEPQSIGQIAQTYPKNQPLCRNGANNLPKRLFQESKTAETDALKQPKRVVCDV